MSCPPRAALVSSPERGDTEHGGCSARPPGPGSGRAGIPGSDRRAGLLAVLGEPYKDGSTESGCALTSRSGLEREDLGEDEAKISKALTEPCCVHAKPLGRAGLHSRSHPCPTGP